MTTDKERAEVYRELAAELPTEAYWSRPMLTRKADELDPPKPQWADGTVAWVTNQYGRRYLCTWHAKNREWCIGGPDGDSAPGKVTKVEPLRVLGDDEIALPREAFERFTVGSTAREVSNQYRAATAREVSEQYRAAGEKFAARAMEAYADALDAEAGEQS